MTTLRAYSLKEALKTVSQTKISTSPSLFSFEKYIRLVQNNGHLDLSHKTQNSYVNIKIPAIDNNTGKLNVMVDKNVLKDLISKINEELILNIQQEQKNKITISSGNDRNSFTYTINAAEDVLDFEYLENETYDVSFDIRANELLRWLALVSYAAASEKQETLRPALCGIYLETQNNKIKACATDSKFLAIIDVTNLDEIENLHGTGSTIIPTEVIGTIETMCQNAGMDKIKVSYNKRVATFVSSNTLIQVNCIEAEYPDLSTVLKEDKAYNFCSVNVGDLVQAINRAQSVNYDNNHLIRLMFTGDYLQVSNQNELIGSGTENIQTISNEVPENTAIILDAKKFLNIIKHIDDTEVKIGIESNNKPVLIKPAQNNLYNHRNLIMPVLM